MIQDPVDLGSGKIRIDHKTGLKPDGIHKSLGFQPVTVVSRAAALRRSGIGQYAALLEAEAPVPDPARAAAVRTAVLAIGARGDLLHPAELLQQ